MIGESAIDYEQIQEILNSESDIYKAGMKMNAMRSQK